MRKTPVLSLAIGLLGFCAPNWLRAELLSQALLSFPASTKSLEYDNLAQLRKLPDYRTLRQQYSGASLQQAQTIFLALGIPEESILEVVSTVGASNFYGVVSGAFSGIEAGKRAGKAGLHRMLIGGQHAICSSSGPCVLFLEDSLAAFGGANELNAMVQARQGTSLRLGAHTPVSELLNKADLHAPVIGIAPGSELAAWIGDAVPSGFLSQANLSDVLRNINLFEYSVHLDNKAHLDLNLECASSLAATALQQSLSAMNVLRSVAANLSSTNSPPPFEHLTVSSNDKLVHLTLDASIH